jgi:hypothetical protein
MESPTLSHVALLSGGRRPSLHVTFLLILSVRHVLATIRHQTQEGDEHRLRELSHSNLRGVSPDESARQEASQVIMSHSILASRHKKGTSDNGSDSDRFGAISTSGDESETLSSMDPPGFGRDPWHDPDFLRDTLWPVDLFDQNDLGWNITYVDDMEEVGEYLHPMQRELNTSATARKSEGPPAARGGELGGTPQRNVHPVRSSYPRAG